MTPKNTAAHLLKIRGDPRRKLTMFLLDMLGGFTQNQITQALPKAKNNAIVKTASST